MQLRQLRIAVLIACAVRHRHRQRLVSALVSSAKATFALKGLIRMTIVVLLSTSEAIRAKYLNRAQMV